MLRKAAVDGKLATRGNANNFKGGYKDIVQGVNYCLDAVIEPLNVAAKYVDDISKGEIPEKINDNYNGDFNTIKNNLNKCIDAVNKLLQMPICYQRLLLKVNLQPVPMHRNIKVILPK